MKTRILALVAAILLQTGTAGTIQAQTSSHSQSSTQTSTTKKATKKGHKAGKGSKKGDGGTTTTPLPSDRDRPRNDPGGEGGRPSAVPPNNPGSEGGRPSVAPAPASKPPR